MSIQRLRPWIFLIGILLCLTLAAGCGYRTVPMATPEPEITPEPTPEITPVPQITHTAAFYDGDTLLSSQELLDGQFAQAPQEIPGKRLVGWTYADGTAADLTQPITADAAFLALTRPIPAAGAPFLFADEHGFLRPDSPFTRADAAAAVSALWPAEGGSLYPAPAAESAGEPLSRDEFIALTESLFAPAEADAQTASILPPVGEYVTRAQAAACLSGLLGPAEIAADGYYPDVCPTYWAHDALLRAAGSGTLTPDALLSQAKDGFLWFDGYLYRLDENGYFFTGEYDSLTFGNNGRYTSGNEELDAFVAQTLTAYTQPENSRLDNLRALYLHVKNDFKYLVRNHYDSGVDGWDQAEALTMFQTGKGNCYNFTGAFCHLARGMGYNARTWSGTIGIRDQPHSWTEISLDGRTYICDPEIELNYWLLDPPVYTDNFMMLKEDSGGWNYQAVGRPGI